MLGPLHFQVFRKWATAIPVWRGLEWFLIATVLPVALVWLAARPGLVQLDGVVYDRMLRLAPSDPSDDIVIVAIDEESLRELGRWPWRRDTHALLLEELAHTYKPRAVFLDLFFTEASEEPEDDKRLAEAMADVPVYLPFLFEVSGAVISGEPADFVPPLTIFAERVRGMGHANLEPDIDGVSRTLYLSEGHFGHMRPYVGTLLGSSPPPLGASEPAEAVKPLEPRHYRLPGAPWIRQNPLLIPFSGPQGTYRTVSYVKVLRGQVEPAELEGKMLLVGATARGLGERIPVPNAGASGSLPGIEVHANAIDSVQEGRHILWVTPGLYAAWVAFSVWLTLLLLGRLARHAILLTVLLAGAYLAISALAMWQFHYWLPPAAPIAGIVALYFMWSRRRMDSIFAYLKQRTLQLDAVALGAFEPLLKPVAVRSDDLSWPKQALDRAIHRITQLQAVLDKALVSMPVGVVLCDETGVVGSSNSAARGLLFGLAPEDAQQHSSGGWYLADALAELRKVPSSGKPHPAGSDHWSVRLQGEYISPRERIFLLEAAVFDVAPAPGLRGWVVVLPELTSEREAQRQRDEWRRFLSHDLRSPQLSILHLLSMYENERGPPHALATIRREAERTLALAEGFVDVTDAESSDYRFTEVSVDTVVLEARDQVWPHAVAKGIHVEVRHGSEDEVFILGDGALLTRAFVNLLNNAIRHSPEGGSIGICLAVAVPEHSEQMGRSLCIAICDEGDGMTDLQLQELLAVPSGRRFGAGLASPPQGIGLGFSFVRSVVRRHGGHIEAVSAPARGTTVWLTLPTGH